MKLVLETNILSFIKSQRSILCRLAILVTMVLLFIGSAWLYGAFQPLIRDFYVANVAYERAGEKILFTEEEAGYSRGFKIDRSDTWSYGIKSNSSWVSEYTRKIIP